MSLAPIPTNKLHPPASLYVGDLPPDVTEKTLYDFFRREGVEVTSMKVCRFASSAPYNPRTASIYAYVNFQSEKDAERVLDTLNHSPIGGNGGKACRIMWQLRDPSIRRSGVGNIFIKNLDPTIGPKELSDTFSQFGDILSCKVAMDEKGNSKGYGFVHFASSESADKAIQATNLKKLRDREVFVGPFVRKKDRMNSQSVWTNLYVKDIDPSVTEEELRRSFQEFGTITSCILMKQRDRDTNFAYINFEEHEQAVKAKEGRHGFILKGRKLWCDRHQKKSERLLELQRGRRLRNNLYIKNLEDDVDDERLKQYFIDQNFGPVQSVKVMTYNGVSRGFGFVCLATSEAAKAAIDTMHRQNIPGLSRYLYVAVAEPRAIREKKLLTRFLNRSHKVHKQNFNVYYPPPANPPFYYPPPMVRPPRPYPPYGVPPVPYPVPAQNIPRQTRRPPHSQNQGARPRVQQNQIRKNADIDANLAELAKYPEDQQRLWLGEKLYPIVQETQPERAGKITGMLLDSGWKIEDLLHLLNDREQLNLKINEAVMVLENAKQGSFVDSGDHH